MSWLNLLHIPMFSTPETSVHVLMRRSTEMGVDLQQLALTSVLKCPDAVLVLQCFYQWKMITLCASVFSSADLLQSEVCGLWCARVQKNVHVVILNLQDLTRPSLIVRRRRRRRRIFISPIAKTITIRT